MAVGNQTEKKLSLPHCSSDNSGGGDDSLQQPYDIETMEGKLIFDYSGIGFSEQQEVDAFSYWQLLRDAVIYRASQTEQGCAWLRRCWAAEQTEPDRQALRRLTGTLRDRQERTV